MRYTQPAVSRPQLLVSAVVCALGLVTATEDALGQARPATPVSTTPADEHGTGTEAPDDTPLLSMRVMPFLRVAPGFSVYASHGGDVFFDADITLGGRWDLTQGRRRLSIVPELGYTYHHGDEVGGHYGTVGVGLRYGTIWIAFQTITAAVLGARDANDGFDAGARVGMRLEAALGFLGLEVAYEYRGVAGGDIHAIHMVLTIDAGILLMPVTLTRMGYSFRNRED